MTSQTVEEWLNTSFKHSDNEIFKDCIKVSDVEIEPLTDQLIIIVSDIFRVKLKLHYKDDKVAELKAVFKMEPTKQGFDKFVKETGICDAEFLVYNTILKAMEKLMNGDEKKDILWPECYHCHDNKFLLRDLCEEGYKLVPSYEMLDFNHTQLAMKAIGKYHAMSLVIIERGMLDTKLIPVNMLTKKLPFLINMHVGNINQLANVIEQDWETEWKPVAQKLRKAVENIDEKLAEMVIQSQGKCSLLVHGDFTIRNVLYKYDDANTPEDIKLLDFQGASWCNLALDLVTILCSSLYPQVREENIDEFLKTYAESLAFWCNHYAYKGPSITLDDIRQSHDAFKYWGMIISLFSIPGFIGARGDFVSEAVSEAMGKLDDAASNMIKPSLLKLKIVEEALKYQLKQYLNRNEI